MPLSDNSATNDRAVAREHLRDLIARAELLSDSDTTRGIALAEEAEQRAIMLGDDEGRANALYSLSENLTMQGQYARALEHLARAQAIFAQHRPTAHRPKVLWLTGKAHNSMGNFAEALRVFTHGLELAREQGDRVMEVRILTGLVSVYTWLDNQETALALGQEALALARSLPYSPNLGSITHASARIRIAMGRTLLAEDDVAANAMFNDALTLLDESFALAQAAGNMQLMMVCNLSRASIAIELGDPIGTREWLAGLDADTAQLKSERYRGSYLTFMGRAHALEGDHRTALAYYERARVRYERINARSYLRRLEHFMSEAYEALGDPACALIHFKRFYTYDRAMNREQARQQAMVLAVRLDLERAKHEAEIHRAQSATLTALNAQLHEKVIRDPLTGLFNRRYLEETLGRELANARRSTLPVSVVTVDLDHFKAINDTYGHAAGDRVLQAIANLLLSHTRLGDTVCRFGGEEFVVVLPGADAASAWQWAARQCRVFAPLRIAHGGTELHATFSAGVATAPADGDSTDALLQASDRALYAAKAAGRNRVVASGNAREPVCRDDEMPPSSEGESLLSSG